MPVFKVVNKGKPVKIVILTKDKEIKVEVISTTKREVGSLFIGKVLFSGLFIDGKSARVLGNDVIYEFKDADELIDAVKKNFKGVTPIADSESRIEDIVFRGEKAKLIYMRIGKKITIEIVSKTREDPKSRSQVYRLRRRPEARLSARSAFTVVSITSFGSAGAE